MINWTPFPILYQQVPLCADRPSSTEEKTHGSQEKIKRQHFSIITRFPCEEQIQGKFDIFKPHIMSIWSTCVERSKLFTSALSCSTSSFGSLHQKTRLKNYVIGSTIYKINFLTEAFFILQVLTLFTKYFGIKFFSGPSEIRSERARNTLKNIIFGLDN